MYIIDMMNANKCDECGKQNGHEIWCNLYTGPVGQSPRPRESEWTIETTFGTRQTFKMALRATKNAAANYACRHVDGAMLDTLKRIA